jgi:CubicO group peptidase (beta-lactamase class C family)
MKLPKIRYVILLAAVVLLTPVLVLAFYLPIGHLVNYLRWGDPALDDYKKRQTRTVKASDAPQAFEVDANFNKKELSADDLRLFAETNTHAFLVLQGGKLKFERYWNGYDQETLSNSFSIAKTLVAMMVGIALEEGKIKSLDQPASDFLPYFRGGGREKVTIRHLLTMSSGLDFKENDTGYFALLGRTYYGNDLAEVVKDFGVEEEPGKIWWYRSGDTAVVGLILEKAYNKSVSELFSEKIFSRIGAERDALWTTDGGNNHELSFCCFNSTAREFARIGQLMLNEGKWKGEQIIPADYYREMTTSAKLNYRSGNQPFERYGYYTHLFKHKGLNIISPNGYRGQYIFVIPEKNAVVVRLGASDWTKQKMENFLFEDNYWFLDAGLNLLD